MEEILSHFLPQAGELKISSLGAGLIHHTYKVQPSGREKAYVLQTFNRRVFQEPAAVCSNYEVAAKQLKASKYPLAVPEWVTTKDDKAFYVDPSGRLWRMFTYLPNSIAYEHAPTPHFLEQAAWAYGLFVNHLDGLAPEELNAVIPDFHNLAGRYEYLLSLVASQPERLPSAQGSLDRTIRFYKTLDLDLSDLPLRATHNDCKLSNVLFDRESGECLAVIDWDTLMPGYLVTDFGDMVRSMCASAPESEKNLEKVHFLPKAYHKIKIAFIKAVGDVMTPVEEERLFDGGLYIVLEQAIRFLSDYLAGDPYYGADYPGQNLDRANNQLQLLASMSAQRM